MAPMVFKAGGACEVTRGKAFDKGDILVVDKVTPGAGRSGAGPTAKVLVFPSGAKSSAYELAGHLAFPGSAHASSARADALRLLAVKSLDMKENELEKASRYFQYCGSLEGVEAPKAPSHTDLSGMKLVNVPALVDGDVFIFDTAEVTAFVSDTTWQVKSSDGTLGTASESVLKRFKAPTVLGDDDSFESKPVSLTGAAASMIPLLKRFPESAKAGEGFVDPMELAVVASKAAAGKDFTDLAAAAETAAERDAYLNAAAIAVVKLYGSRPFPSSFTAPTLAALGKELVNRATTGPDSEVEVVRFPRAAAFQALASSTADWDRAVKRVIGIIDKENATDILAESVYINQHIDRFLSFLTVTNVAGRASMGSLPTVDLVSLFYDFQHEKTAEEKKSSASQPDAMAKAVAEALRDGQVDKRSREYVPGLSAQENAQLSQLRNAAIAVFKDPVLTLKVKLLSTMADSGQLDKLNDELKKESDTNLCLLFQSSVDNVEKQLQPVLDADHFEAVSSIRHSVQLRLERELFGEKTVPALISKQLSHVIARKPSKIQPSELVGRELKGGRSEPLSQLNQLGEEQSLTVYLQAMGALQDAFFQVTPDQAYALNAFLRELKAWVTLYRNKRASWAILDKWHAQVLKRVEKASRNHATPTAPLSWDLEHIKGNSDYRDEFLQAFNEEIAQRAAGSKGQQHQQRQPLGKRKQQPDGVQPDPPAKKITYKPASWSKAMKELTAKVGLKNKMRPCAFHFVLESGCDLGTDCKAGHHEGQKGQYRHLLKDSDKQPLNGP